MKNRQKRNEGRVRFEGMKKIKQRSTPSNANYCEQEDHLRANQV